MILSCVSVDGESGWWGAAGGLPVQQGAGAFQVGAGVDVHGLQLLAIDISLSKE